MKQTLLKKNIVFLAELGAFFLLILKFFYKFKFLNSFTKRQILRQLYFTGVQATLFASILSVFLGTVTILESLAFSSRFWVSEFVSKILVVIIVRELGPILIALIIIGRSGTAIATELGNMQVNNEINAIETEGVDPIEIIVLPRVIGVSISTLCLSIYFSFVAVIGGIVVSNFVLSIPIGELILQVQKAITINDIIINIVKSLIFGGVISIVSAFNGLNIQKSPIYVPQATTKSVVESIMICFLIDGIIALFTFNINMVSIW